jgi:hypothetical protein
MDSIVCGRTGALGRVRVLTSALLLLSLAIAPPARAESPIGFRIGISRSQLEGELGATYPAPALSGMIGMSLRTAWSPWRVRTGVSYVARMGHGSVPLMGLVPDSSGFVHEGVLGYVDESWRTQWLDIPLTIEYVPGHGKVRPYASVGEALAYRLPANGNVSSPTIPPDKALRLNASVSVATGLEFKLEKGVARVEIEFAQGLRSLYDSASGPDGSWRAWTLSLDVSP